MRNVLIGLAILTLTQDAGAAGWTQPGPRGEIAREGKAFVCNGLGVAKGKKLPKWLRAAVVASSSCLRLLALCLGRHLVHTQ